MEDNKQILRNQIIEVAGNVQYTYMAHWIIVNRHKMQYLGIKVIQIILTALSTGGFLAFILTNVPQLSWVGGFTAALALALNLYMLNFRIPDSIKQHTDAANNLWEVREKYKSLLVDFDILDISEIRKRRDMLMMDVSRINKAYPGTDARSFIKAQKGLKNYLFIDGEAAKTINMGNKEKA